MRRLSGRSLTLRHTFMDGETPIVPASCSVAIRADGASSDAWTGVATESASQWTVTPPALPQGSYWVTWDGSTVLDLDALEIVGNFLFSVADVRGVDPDITATRFPTATIEAYRDLVELEFERITHRSFTRRTRRVEFEVDSSDETWLGLLDCAAFSGLQNAEGTPVATQLRMTTDGLLTGLSELPTGIYSLAVDYGMRSVPEDVRRIGLLRVRSLIAAERSGVPDRATSFTAVEGGVFSLATPGRNGYTTGIPDVDAVLEGYTPKILRDSGLW